MRFSKKTPTKSFDDLPVDGVSYKPKTSEPAVIKEAQKSAASKTMIGRKITLKGELTGEEDILIEGRLEGNINLVGHTVNIGAQGTLESNIKARSIVAEGCINGDIEAMDIITVKSGSNVHGNLKSNRVQLDDGAKFWGGINTTLPSHSESSPNSGA